VIPGTYPGFFPDTAYFSARGLPVKMGPPLTKGASIAKRKKASCGPLRGLSRGGASQKWKMWPHQRATFASIGLSCQKWRMWPLRGPHAIVGDLLPLFFSAVFLKIKVIFGG